MPNTKKLLSITNLKKYFPVAKTSIFQKNTLYVRANEDITIDIYEGETLGIVGESGCGKSTFGRVLLQLYPQTAGCTLYYGTTLDRLTPSYVEDTIVHHEKYRRKLKKSTEKYEELHKKGSAIILITHYMEEVERLCDRILLLRDGKAKAYGTVKDVRKEFGGKTLDEIFVEVYGAKEDE